MSFSISISTNYYLQMWLCSYISNQSVDSRKGKKQRQQGKKGGTANTEPICRSDGAPPDMGALCIWFSTESMSDAANESVL